MTNEVVKRPSSEPVTIANNANQALYKNCREWREYASALEEDVKNLSERVIELGEQSQPEIESLKSQLISREKQILQLKEADKAQGKEIVKLKSQLQQQALPVVPECVAEWYEFHMNGTFSAVVAAYAFNRNDKAVVWLKENGGMDLLCQMKLNGYTVEKPQLFKLIFPNSTAVLQKDGELNSFADTVYKRYLMENAMTEQEIKSIDERYWQFAVPVEDGE
jgi:seryl-tRNA synthetase